MSDEELSPTTLRDKRYRLRQVRRARGEKLDLDLIPADETRKILQAARDRGVTIKEMGRIIGNYNSRMPIYILHGHQTRIRRKTAKKIEAAFAEKDIRNFTKRSLVPITIERDLVRRLMAQGWSLAHQQQILRQNGRGTGSIVKTLNNKTTDRACFEHLEQVRWLARVIGNKVGPSKRGATMMQQRGIFPLRHYTERGELLVRTLSDEQRQWIQS